MQENVTLDSSYKKINQRPRKDSVRIDLPGKTCSLEIRQHSIALIIIG